MIVILFYQGGPYLKKGGQAYEKRTPQNSIFCYESRKVIVDVEKLSKELQLENQVQIYLEQEIQIEQGTNDDSEFVDAAIKPETYRNFLTDLMND